MAVAQQMNAIGAHHAEVADGIRAGTDMWPRFEGESADAKEALDRAVDASECALAMETQARAVT
jgi:hypothetical protein